MPARSDRSPVSRLDPGRADRRPDAGAGADAVLAFFVPRDGDGLGGVLAARAPAGLARSAGIDQARAGHSRRRPASVHGASAVFQGRAGAAPAARFRGAAMNGTITPMVGRYVY